MDGVHEIAPEGKRIRTRRAAPAASAHAVPFSATTLPSRNLLADTVQAPGPDEEATASVRTLSDLFEQFQIDAYCVSHTRGPAVVSHRIALGSDASAPRFIAFARNIEYALPGARVKTDTEGRITVDVPTTRRGRVLLGELLGAPVLESAHPLTAALGVDRSGAPIIVNIAELPHLLMAGTTGSGKSTSLHAMLLSVLTQANPDQVRMILIDTRSLELGRHERVAHLVTPVATRPEKAARALAWAAREAQQRLDDFAEAGMRRVEDYNAAVRSDRIRAPLGGSVPSVYPLLLIAIDDLADLLRSPQHREIQDSLPQIGTRGRITGIHVTAGTRHPQAYALPPRVSATMPARLSFAATEGPSSTRTVRVGVAELRIPGSAPAEVWCADVREQEIDAVADHWRAGQRS